MHVLYRFYDRSDHLLYVGITNNPAARFKQHEHGKDWWDQVASITLERHESRQALMDAEREAIVAEQPAYNVVHNTKAPAPRKALPRLRVGSFIAAGLRSGRCLIGEVVEITEDWIVLQTKDPFSGFYWGPERAMLLADVVEIEFAYEGRSGEVDDRHLTHFQTYWERSGRAQRGSDRGRIVMPS